MLAEPVTFIARYRELDGEIQTVDQHSCETADYCMRFAGKIKMGLFGELTGLLHDTGKYTEEFYRYIRSVTGLIQPSHPDYLMAARGTIDHATAGAQFIYESYHKREKKCPTSAQMLAQVVVSHHSGLIDCLSGEFQQSGFDERIIKEDKLTRMRESVRNLSPYIREKAEALIYGDELTDQIHAALKSLTLAPGNNKTKFFKIGLLTRNLLSCLIDADRLSSAEFEFPEQKKLRNHGEYKSWSVLIERLEAHLGGLKGTGELNEFRRLVSQRCLEHACRPKGIHQLTVPTGGGKTLASLRYALHHAKHYELERIFFILPYTSIIEQNAETVRDILEETDDSGHLRLEIVLEQHSNLTPAKESEHHKLLAENWDAPIIFTTMVQLLETLFGSGTRSVRRMHQLTKAVLVFDEIQTIPLRCVHLFNVAIQYLTGHGQSTVLLCTATQPLLDQVKPSDYALAITPEQQILPDSDHFFRQTNRVKLEDRIRPEGWSDQEAAQLAIEETGNFRSVLVIVNTKRSAKRLFDFLRGCPAAQLFHLSTDMCAEHRMNKLRLIKKYLKEEPLTPLICVSTSVIEAGVDIDFACVIRYLAGLDSITQAAGRCNREGVKPQPGKVIVINSSTERLDNLADIQSGKKITERVLREYKDDPAAFGYDPLGPRALDRYYKYYFHEQTPLMCYPVNKICKLGRDDNLFEMLSLNRQVVNRYKGNKVCSLLPLHQDFASASKLFQAVDSDGVGVIVPYGEKGNEIIAKIRNDASLRNKQPLLKEAQRYSINAHPQAFARLLDREAVFPLDAENSIYALDKNFYDDQVGLREEAGL